VQFWNYEGANANGNGGNGTGNGWVDLVPGFGHPFETGHPYHGSVTFGPELSFGAAMHDAFPEDRIYLVKYGMSSTTLAYDWSPARSDGYYATFKARVNAAMQDLRAKGLAPSIAGMLWMQGESDTYAGPNGGADWSAAYGDNLTNFIGKVRSDFGAPEMKFALGRITSYYGPVQNNAMVRAAQMAIPQHVANTACINTDDLQWAYPGHYGAQGQIDLGNRFAHEFIQTPEPSAFALALTGALAFVGWRWQRRRSSIV
jgi:hypothetical protein